MPNNYPVGNPLLKKSFSKTPDVAKLNEVLRQLKQQQALASKEEPGHSSSTVNGGS